MYLLSISQEDILKTEIGWCEPWVFDLNDNQEVVKLDIMCSSSKSDSHLPEKYAIK